MPEKMKFFDCPYRIPCETWGCMKPAAYFLGRPDATRATHMPYCEDCVRHALEHLPDTLRDALTLTKPGTETDTKTNTDSETKTNTYTSTDTGTNAKPSTGTDTDTESKTSTGTGTSPKIATNTDTKTDTKTGTSMDSLTVTELKTLAKQSGITGYSDMNKGELLKALGKKK